MLIGIFFYFHTSLFIITNWFNFHWIIFRSPELSDNEDTSEDINDKKDSNKADKESSVKLDKAVLDIVTSDKDMSKEINKKKEVSTNEEISSKGIRSIFAIAKKM